MPTRLPDLSRKTNLGTGVRLRDLSAPPKKPKKKDGGGLWGTIKRLPGDFGRGAYKAAVNTPAGVYATGKALSLDTRDVARAIGRQEGGDFTPSRTAKLGKAIGQQVVEDFRHPLRDPFATLLNVASVASLGAGAAARAGAAGKAAGAAGKAKALVVKPQPGPRIVRVNELEAKGLYSLNAAVRGAQRAKDTVRQKVADKNPSGRSAARLERQAERYLRAERRVTEAKARSAAARLEAMGKRLKPEEQMALRLVAEEAPVKRRIAASEMRASQAKSKRETKRHRERIDLKEKALAFLDEDANGRPVFKPEATRLRAVYGQIEKVAADREAKLAAIDVLSPEGAAKHKTDVGRVALDDDTFEASPDAVYIGDPVYKSRLTGKPRVGAQTIGHPRKPGSLKTYTGKAKATARERLDTTRIVAERNLEAVRLTSILRARDQLKGAGRPAPGREDDLFMRLDKLPSHKNLPPEVRQYLDDPESLAELPPEKASGVVDRVRDAMFSDEWKVNPESQAAFERLAQQGKGVFVPRRVVGSLAKRAPNPTGRTIRTADAINNAQKLAVVYLKPGYILPQQVSNAFMNLTQQGFAAPKNITRAVRMNHRLGDDTTALIDDLMGEGFIRQLGGEGQGRAGRAASWTAGKLGKVVDTPFRRASFLHEAAKRGYKTPAQIKRLLGDGALTDELAQVVTRANREVVDFGDMNDIERAVVRRVIFVYPWVKGSTMYAGRTVRDKPVQAAVFQKAGEQAMQDPGLSPGPTPSYLEGAFRVGGRLANPASASAFQTPAQAARAAAGIVTGDPSRVAQPAGFASPALSFALALATGRDQSGYPTGGLANAAREEFLESQPLMGIARALGQFGGSRSKLYRDTPQDALLRYAIGGFYPRRYNEPELRKRAKRGD